MHAWFVLAALAYATLAVAHSWLGERAIIRPLLAAPWPLALPPELGRAIVRWAWHLASAAWLAAAAILGWAGGGGAVSRFTLDALAALAGVSAVAIAVPGRGRHPAWAGFALAAWATLVGAHGWPAASARTAIAAIVATVLLGLAGLHVYWAGGGRWGLAAAVPQGPDLTPRFQPSPAAALAVAMALTLAASIVVSAAGLAPETRWSRGAALVVAAVFAARTVGDFRSFGLFRRQHRGAFARWDAMLYSPLCAALALSSAAAAS